MFQVYISRIAQGVFFGVPMDCDVNQFLPGLALEKMEVLNVFPYDPHWSNRGNL